MKVNLKNPCLSTYGKNKMGAMHFEMIVSIIFFTGFIFFLFIIINPQDKSLLPNSAVPGLYDSFIEKAHVNLSSMFVKTNYTGNNSCFSVSLPLDIFAYNMTNENSYIEKLDGKKVNSSFSNGYLNIESNQTFFKVLISSEFESKSIAGCDSLNNYQLGSITEKQVLSYSALENMTRKYYSNYDDLKNDLRVPTVFDFSIVAEDLPDIKMEPTIDIPDSIEVLSRTYISEVLKKDGSMINERFTLKIW